MKIITYIYILRRELFSYDAVTCSIAPCFKRNSGATCVFYDIMRLRFCPVCRFQAAQVDCFAGSAFFQ